MKNPSSVLPLAVVWPLYSGQPVRLTPRKDTTLKLQSTQGNDNDYNNANKIMITLMIIRNPEVPQSSASLAQMTLAQRLEQQQMQVISEKLIVMGYYSLFT